MAEAGDLLTAWEQRCKSHGLSMTASRRAILAAMLQSNAAADAVAWLVAAQRHHPSTSIGTVYRFLRDLEQRGMADVHAEPHARCRWRLREGTPMLQTVEPLLSLLREMETLGLAETLDAQPVLKSDARSAPTQSPSTWQLLQQIATNLGYRLVVRHRNPAY